MAKNPALQNMLDSLAAQAGLKPENKHSGDCIRCGFPALEPYKDEAGVEQPVRCKTEIDRKEFGISGFCGVCWEAIFPEDPESPEED